MKRRDFLKFPIAAAALSPLARSAEALTHSPERTTRGFRVAAQQDRHTAALSIMGGRFDLKVSGKDTDGALCIYDTVRETKGGPPLHRHHAQDEWFYIVRGEFLVRVGNDTHTLGPGDSAFVPRGTPHAFAMTSSGEGQMLVLFQPAGSMEDFFAAMSRVGKQVGSSQGLAKQVWAEHGIELLGPPLAY